MGSDEITRSFSQNRLSGEAVPDDIAILLRHHDELAQRTGFSFNWENDWQP